MPLQTAMDPNASRRHCPVKSEEIQLLADGLQPVFALESTPFAETLIQRELCTVSRYLPAQKARMLCSDDYGQGRWSLCGSVD